MDVVMLYYEIVNLNYTHLFIVTDHGDIVNGKHVHIYVYLLRLQCLSYMLPNPPAVVDGK